MTCVSAKVVRGEGEAEEMERRRRRWRQARRGWMERISGLLVEWKRVTEWVEAGEDGGVYEVIKAW